MWVVFALLSALTAVLAKIGIENVDPTLATAIRTVVVPVLAFVILGEAFTAKTVIGGLRS